MKKQLLLTLFLTVHILYAQKKAVFSGEVSYTASLVFSKEGFEKKLNKIPKKHRVFLQKTMQQSEDLTYVLVFKEEKSIFYLDKRLVVDDKKKAFNVVKTLGGSSIFYNEKNLLIQQKESAGETFIITMPPIKWQITTEKKKIGHYVCYKATTEKKTENNSGVFTKNVVAWYTPDIPLNLGPKNYRGLPGLILELQEGKLIFYANKIKLNTLRNLSIKKPTKGKKITLSDYKKLMKRIYGRGRR